MIAYSRNMWKFRAVIVAWEFRIIDDLMTAVVRNLKRGLVDVGDIVPRDVNGPTFGGKD